jgi:hypothetical protein
MAFYVKISPVLNVIIPNQYNERRGLRLRDEVEYRSAKVPEG